MITRNSRLGLALAVVCGLLPVADRAVSQVPYVIAPYPTVTPPHPYVTPPHPYVTPPHPYVTPPHPYVTPPYPTLLNPLPDPPMPPVVIPENRWQEQIDRAVERIRNVPPPPPDLTYVPAPGVCYGKCALPPSWGRR